jgi:hypothetical protein
MERVKTMALNILRFVSVILTAVTMAGGFAHLFELPYKIALPREAYLTVQQIYRGWALLGIAVVGALLSTLAVAIVLQRDKTQFYLTGTAALCLALSLFVFFLFIFPANRQTQNWTILPENWEQLRRQWEYSHAVNAALYFVALSALVLSLLAERE